ADAGAARSDISCARCGCSSSTTRRCRGARSAHGPTGSRSSTRRSPTPRRCVSPKRLSNLIRAASDRRAPRGVLRIVALTVAFRLVSAVIALLVNLVFPLDQREQFTVFESTSPFWDAFARYDSGHFEGIAWGGYAPL